MESHLRLADRQGLLVGPKLSRVQDLAGEYMSTVESKDRADQNLLNLKMALVSFDPKMAAQLFDWKTEDDDEIDLDETNVTYEFNPNMDPARVRQMAESLLEQHLETKTGTVTMEEVLGDQVKENPWV